jgi:putative colanic acid biosynthesis UDP-glucose lipid carrier transferase
MYISNISDQIQIVESMAKKNIFFVQLFDVLAIILSGIIAYTGYFSLAEWPIHTNYIIAIVLSVLLTIIIFPLFNVNQLYGNDLFSYIHKLFLAWLTVIAILIAIAFSLKLSDHFSRKWLFSWTFLSLLLLFSTRLILHYIIYLTAKDNFKKIVIVGAQGLGQTLAQRIRSAKPYLNIDIIAFFDDDETLRNKAVENIHVNGNILNLSRFVRDNEVDEVWVTPQYIDQAYLEKILHNLRYNLVTIRFIPNIFSFHPINYSVSKFLGLPVISLTESPMTNEVNCALKTIEDKILASLILLALSPLMLMIAIGVKLSSPGPIFYRQERMGWNGKVFKMLKFRTMPINIEKETGPVWAKASENRATRFGCLLRHTSLDELPQLWNVLTGEMSIVGPRPERPYFVEKFKEDIPEYMQKHLVKAGITGWAQVNGWRGDTDLHKRIEHDIYYIEHWSVWLDLKIILLTMFKIIADKNAY